MTLIEKLFACLIAVMFLLMAVVVGTYALTAPEQTPEKPDVITFDSADGQMQCAVLVYRGQVHGFSCVPTIPPRGKRSAEMEAK